VFIENAHHTSNIPKLKGVIDFCFFADKCIEFMNYEFSYFLLSINQSINQFIDLFLLIYFY